MIPFSSINVPSLIEVLPNAITSNSPLSAVRIPTLIPSPLAPVKSSWLIVAIPVTVNQLMVEIPTSSRATSWKATVAIPVCWLLKKLASLLTVKPRVLIFPVNGYGTPSSSVIVISLPWTLLILAKLGTVRIPMFALSASRNSISSSLNVPTPVVFWNSNSIKVAIPVATSRSFIVAIPETSRSSVNSCGMN